jgi:hypothetical protein
VNAGVRLLGRGALPVVLAFAIVPGLSAAATGRSAVAAIPDPAWAGSTAPTAGLSPPPAAPVGNGVVLGSVSCPAAGSCVAVGHYANATAGTVPLAETLSGGPWTATAVPTSGLNPPDENSARLTKVSCPAAGTCVAIGTYLAAPNDLQSVIATLSGGSWTAMTAPAPAANRVVELLGISCPAAGSCVAAGYYRDPSGGLHPLIDTLSAGTWTAGDLPVSGLSPPAASNVGLRLVSCPVTGSCAAAGVYTDTSGHRQGLLASLAGGTWTAVTAPTSGLAPAHLPTRVCCSRRCPARPQGPARPPAAMLTPRTRRTRYWIATSGANVYPFNAPAYPTKATAGTVGIAADSAGYLLVTKAGNVYPFHTAFYGSKAGHKLPAPVVGITAAR